jgi:hypothetical protein
MYRSLPLRAVYSYARCPDVMWNSGRRYKKVPEGKVLDRDGGISQAKTGGRKERARYAEP